MNEQEYLDLFKHQNVGENLNETSQQPQNYQNYQNLNETPDLSQYERMENLNDGWGSVDLDIQTETRIDGVVQNQGYQQYQQLQPNSRRHRNTGPNLNGLDGFIDPDDDLREVVKAPVMQPAAAVPVATENIKDVDVVSVAMFENMNSEALIGFSNRILSNMDTSKVTNSGSETTVRFLKS